MGVGPGEGGEILWMGGVGLSAAFVCQGQEQSREEVIGIVVDRLLEYVCRGRGVAGLQQQHA